MVRRVALIVCCVLSVSSVGPTGQAEPPAFPLDEATVEQLQQWMQTGRYTSRQLVDLYLARIEQIDRSGPTLRSVIEVNPDARAIADALDAERTARGTRGPLHGIPVLIKDNIDTADRMMTTAGSLALEGSIAARDAFIVGRLRAAGAVILGKTNLSEWANFRSAKSSSGWSGRGGQTKTLMRSTGIPAARARGAAPPSRPTWRRSAWARRPTAPFTVPAGDVHGLPVGLAFIGRAWSEQKLINLAYAFEQATKHRQPPKFLATVGY